jgi:hypothetical protein
MPQPTEKRPHEKKNLSPKELKPEEEAIERLAKSEGITRAAAAARLAHEKLPPHIRNPVRVVTPPAEETPKEVTE